MVDIDADAAVVALAKASGIYRQLIQAPAECTDVPEAGFGSAFANCSLEHIDNLEGLLNMEDEPSKTIGAVLHATRA